MENPKWFFYGIAAKSLCGTFIFNSFIAYLTFKPQLLNFCFQQTICFNDLLGNTLAVLSSLHNVSPADRYRVCVLCRYYSGSCLFPTGFLRGFESSSASPTWISMSKHHWKAKFTLTPLHTRFSSSYTIFSPVLLREKEVGICCTW